MAKVLVRQSSLATPPFNVSRYGRVQFDHQFDLEDFFDCAVLEIKIGQGPFVDIESAGGQFVAGRYNDVLIDSDNPIDVERLGRKAWTGGSGGYQHVVANLPGTANSQTVQLRWRVGADHNNTSPHEGYWLDNIVVTPNDSDVIFRDGF